MEFYKNNLTYFMDGILDLKNQEHFSELNHLFCVNFFNL